MVQVAKMLLGLAAMLMAGAVPTTFADKAPAFEVPTFDYETLSTGNTPNDVLDALKKDGIISFTNVPSYAQVRHAYLDSAAACAVSAQEANAEFLLHKTLSDGTNRYTISTPSDQKANPNATATHAACPGYSTVYNEFSSLLELVVLNVATTLDATNFTTKEGYGQTVSSRKLMTDAVRLDHFHAYEAPSVRERRLTSASTSTSNEDDLTLELHEDDGMFIAFATPAFYKVSSDGTKSTFEPVSAGGQDDSESGLIIQRRDGQRVRPVLKPDQVTLMVGTGYNRWVATSEQLPAVMHGVRMPMVETTESQRLLRAWFGKMTLLPSYQRMLKQMDFGVHANTTARYVQQGYQSDHQSLGCAPGRRLVASASSECSFNACTVKSGATAPSDGCSVVCNRSHSTDADECSKSCDCTVSTRSATTCWMLCVKDLDVMLWSDQGVRLSHCAFSSGAYQCSDSDHGSPYDAGAYDRPDSNYDGAVHAFRAFYAVIGRLDSDHRGAIDAFYPVLPRHFHGRQPSVRSERGARRGPFVHDSHPHLLSDDQLYGIRLVQRNTRPRERPRRMLRSSVHDSLPFIDLFNTSSQSSKIVQANAMCHANAPDLLAGFVGWGAISAGSARRETDDTKGILLAAIWQLSIWGCCGIHVIYTSK